MNHVPDTWNSSKSPLPWLSTVTISNHVSVFQALPPTPPSPLLLPALLLHRGKQSQQMDLPFTGHSLCLKRLVCSHILLPSYHSSAKHRQLLFKDNASVRITDSFLVASPLGSISSNTQDDIFSHILWALSMFRYHGKYHKLL